MELTGSVVGSLAWPIVVIAALIIFRVQIGSLAGRSLRRIKAGPLEAEWGETLQEIKTGLEVETLVEEVIGPATPSEHHAIERIRQLAKFEPDIAVMAAYQLVETELMRIAELSGVEQLRPGWTRARNWSMRELLDRGLLSGVVVSAINRLRRLRNLAAHPASSSGAIDHADAMNYLATVEDVLEILSREWEVRNALAGTLPTDARGSRTDRQ